MMMPPVLAFLAAGAVMVFAVLLIVLALVFYLVSVILALRKITGGLDEVIGGVGKIVRQTAPVNGVVTTINQHLDTGVDLLEGLLVKKAGIEDAVGLVDGLYPGAGGAGFRRTAGSATTRPPRIGEVYTKGTLTLARLGREAPIAAGNPAGPVLRNVEGGSLAARALYPDVRQDRPQSLQKSPVIGTGAPVQYEQREDIGAPRKRLPARSTFAKAPAGGPPPAPPAAPRTAGAPPSAPPAPGPPAQPDVNPYRKGPS